MGLSSLSLRLISSAVLIPSVLLVLWLGGWVLLAFVVGLFVIAYSEWLNITKWDGQRQWGLSFLGFFYIALSFACFYDIATHGPKLLLALYLLLAVWGSDTGAYLFGKTLKGPKLAPKISPNKTWSGFVGACLVPAIILFGYKIGLSSYRADVELGGLMNDSILFLMIGGVAGIAGQIGDLSVSLLKRKSGLKDTGHLIPGHGGILDRIDALLLANILLWLWLQNGGYSVLFPHMEEGWSSTWLSLLAF